MGAEGDDGRVIAGRYRLRARVGRGGMGVVWRADDQLLGRQVAVKELAGDDDLPDEEAARRRERTFREARAVAQLRHPHIVVVHDVVEQDERPYLVMELIDGGSLADRIAADGPVDAAEAARIGVDLLAALGTAHAAGVLHRDVKPANVLIESGTGRVVLTDFGIARLAGTTTLTETGAFVGSPEYTAPERMSGGTTGPESDLWSVGVLLCAVLSGESPFRRDSMGGVWHAVVAAEIRLPEQAGPLLPVVRGLLERDPGRRLGAPEAARMLRAFLETGRTPRAAAVTEPGRAPRRTPAARRGSWTDWSPTETDVPRRRTGTPGAGRRPRGVLIAAVLAAAVVGAGVSAALLADRADGGSGGGSSTGSGTGTGGGAGSAGTPSSAVSGRSADPSGASGSSASAKSADPHGTSVSAAPAGYRTAHDPAGFSLAVPEDFSRDLQGERVFYLSPGQTFRLGIKVSAPQPGGPEQVLSKASAEGSRTNPGYRDTTLVESVHAGLPAASWEFTWNGYTRTEGPRHTYDTCWEQSGRMYDVWVSAPVGRGAEAKRYFDTALDTFVPKSS
ncbi:serine/threonine protein kinase [Streptomyces sp. J2-1]|uniref:serine/threonine-protein kinase n=1 Tax=Streptomyces corallincola TaxID=2851888 RepID=UPI001C38D18A|nr:serine/threonine-protein kinase [Streptomyces corallincola]MBV2355758.1 serine/threonine protein kinase [Streptomyces corallincola]